MNCSHKIHFVIGCFILAIFLSLTGCGKRPDIVDPPDGADPKAYPRSYPDISTDPSGHVNPQ
ncbi:MAG: hypothetical protein EB059_06035 [Alphaproteobacteria bacterium]|nr:hypothetical protein [Alphaproteobacteria bacterium]